MDKARGKFAMWTIYFFAWTLCALVAGEWKMVAGLIAASVVGGLLWEFLPARIYWWRFDRETRRSRAHL